MNILSSDKVEEFLNQLPSWQLDQKQKSIWRECTLKNFVAVINLINQIALIAEAENHHPDIHLTSYRKLRIELSTHALGGLSKKDFLLAKKFEKIFKKIPTYR